MQSLSESPRIIPDSYLDLPAPMGQRDSSLYSDLSADGSVNYEATNFATPSDEDIYILAEEIHVLKTAKEKGKTLRRHVDVSTGPNIYPLIASLPFVEEIKAVEFSPANIVRLRELTGKDPKTGEYTETPVPLPEYWENWKYIAALLYDIGGAVGLDNMAADERAELFRVIKGLPYFSSEQKQTELARLTDSETNPYMQIENLQDSLGRKVEIIRGDIIDRIKGEDREERKARLFTSLEMDQLKPYIESWENTPEKHSELMDTLRDWGNLDDDKRNDVYKTYFPSLSRKNVMQAVKWQFERVANLADIHLVDITHLTGTADYLTKHFASESVSADPRVVAQYETNWIQIARPGAIVVSAHMAGTQGYDTFMTEQERATPSKKRGLEELYATSSFFKEFLGQIISPFDEAQHRQGLITKTDDKVRTGYAGMVVISGYADHLKSHGQHPPKNKKGWPSTMLEGRDLKFLNGAELLRSLSAPDAFRGDRAFVTEKAPELHSRVLRINNSTPAKPFFCTWDEFFKKDGLRDRMAEVRGGLTQSPKDMLTWQKDEPDNWDIYYEPKVYAPAIESARKRFFIDGGVTFMRARDGIRSHHPDERNFTPRFERLKSHFNSFSMLKRREEGHAERERRRNAEEKLVGLRR